MPIEKAYGSHPRHKLDIFPCRGPLSSDGAPILAFIYGGGWKAGSRKLYRLVARSFAAKGFCVFVPDYRLFPVVRYPDFMEDAALALSWIMQNGAFFGGNPERIAVMGHSAGAHIGALVLTNRRFLAAHGLEPEQFKAFVGLAGPYSFNPLEYDSTRDIFQTALEIDDARPIKHVSGREPSMLLAHGVRDQVVGVHNTDHLHEAVNARGGSCRKILYPRVGHVGVVAGLAGPLHWYVPVFHDSVKFLRTRL